MPPGPPGPPGTPVQLMRQHGLLVQAVSLIIKNLLETECRYVKFWRTEKSFSFGVITGKNSPRKKGDPDTYDLVAIDNAWSGGTCEITNCKQWIFNPLVDEGENPKINTWEPLHDGLDELNRILSKLEPKEEAEKPEGESAITGTATPAATA